MKPRRSPRPHRASGRRLCSLSLLIGAFLILGALPPEADAFYTPRAVSDSYWAAWNGAVVEDNQWILYPTDTGFVVWNDQNHEIYSANFACSDEHGGQDGIMVGGEQGPGGGQATMTEGGVLYAVLDLGTILPEKWGSILAAGLPNTNTAICDAIDQEYDPSHDAFTREVELQPPEVDLWVNPMTGRPQEAIDVLVVSTNKGRTWQLASTPQASATIGNPHGANLSSAEGTEAEDPDGMLLMPAATGVRWGDPGYGYTVFTARGWSAVADAGNTYGFDFGSRTEGQGSLDPGTSGPNGYILTATRRLSNGAIWALWQPSWVSGGGETHVNYAAQITETLNGRVYRRVRVDPRFRVADYIGGTLVSPGCVAPRSAVDEGIYTAMPSSNAQTIYATTAHEAPWRPGCHNKYVNVSAIRVVPTVIVSHNGGTTWKRVKLPNLGADTQAFEVLTVDGTQPVVGLESNRHVCGKGNALMYDRLSDGHWRSIGCRDTEVPFSGEIG